MTTGRRRSKKCGAFAHAFEWARPMKLVPMMPTRSGADVDAERVDRDADFDDFFDADLAMVGVP
jgi:hypothetical protein